MEKIEITKAEARRFLIHYHGLDSRDTFSGEKGILEYIRRVGCIQYDPLNVVGRNVDLVLQSRIRDYTPEALERLLYEERSLVDGWDKMMAIYLAEDWPFFHRVRARKEKEVKATLKNRNSLEAVSLTGEIRKLLVEQGPLQATQISIGESANCGRWGHGKLSSAALDYMFNIGELGIRSKRNNHKVYDLIENLLPHELLEAKEPFSSDNDFYKWYFKRRIGSVGLLWGRNGGGWLGHFLSDKQLRDSSIGELLEDRSIQQVSIEDMKEIFYIRQEDLAVLDSVPKEQEKAVRVLAPLDNLLWDRDMTKRLFDFEYTWEVYVPLEKRKYGYYVLPVLYGSRLVARFEPEKHRGKEPLEIKNWWWEEGIEVTKEMLHEVQEELNIFCQYLQAEGIQKESLKKIGIV